MTMKYYHFLLYFVSLLHHLQLILFYLFHFFHFVEFLLLPINRILVFYDFFEFFKNKIILTSCIANIVSFLLSIWLSSKLIVSVDVSVGVSKISELYNKKKKKIVKYIVHNNVKGKQKLLTCVITTWLFVLIDSNEESFEKFWLSKWSNFSFVLLKDLVRALSFSLCFS